MHLDRLVNKNKIQDRSYLNNPAKTIEYISLCCTGKKANVFMYNSEGEVLLKCECGREYWVRNSHLMPYKNNIDNTKIITTEDKTNKDPTIPQIIDAEFYEVSKSSRKEPLELTVLLFRLRIK